MCDKPDVIVFLQEFTTIVTGDTLWQIIVPEGYQLEFKQGCYKHSGLTSENIFFDVLIDATWRHIGALPEGGGALFDDYNNNGLWFDEGTHLKIYTTFSGTLNFLLILVNYRLWPKKTD